MKIFHGSMYEAETLKPGFEHTKKLVEWDETESNKFLYACDDRETAILLGIGSYFFNRFKVASLNIDVDHKNKRKKNTLTFTFYEFPHVDIRKVNPVIYLYTLELTKEWVKVNNKTNRLSGEYKTNTEVTPESKYVINVLDYLADKNILLDFKLAENKGHKK